MGLEAINNIRKFKKLTIEGLAAKSNVPLSTVKKICAGITTNPNLDTVIALAEALECSIDDFKPTSTVKKTPPSEDRGVTEEEFELVEIYRELNEEGQRAYRAAANGFFSIPEYKKCNDFENGATVNRDNDIAG